MRIEFQRINVSVPCNYRDNEEHWMRSVLSAQRWWLHTSTGVVFFLFSNYLMIKNEDSVKKITDMVADEFHRIILDSGFECRGLVFYDCSLGEGPETVTVQ